MLGKEIQSSFIAEYVNWIFLNVKPYPKGLANLVLLHKTTNGWALNTFFFNPVQELSRE